MEINENLFDLSEEQIELSKEIYNGKVIKCLVAPYHSYAELENIISYTPTTFLFPERELTSDRIRGLVSMIVNNHNDSEFRIITASQSVILDMVDSSVRILTQKGTVVPCPVKTFMANIHDIRYKVLENKDHQFSEEEKTKSHEFVDGLLKRIKSGSMTREEYDDLIEKIELVGDDLIRNVLMKQARMDITITGESSEDLRIQHLEKEIERLKKLKGDLE
jgi:hypothetical protein